MLSEVETQEEWSASVCSMVASELLHGAKLGVLTPSEAEQLATRFVILLEQTLDLPSLRTSMAALNPWNCLRLRP